MSVRLRVRPHVRPLSVRPSVCPTIHPIIHLSMHASIFVHIIQIFIFISYFSLIRHPPTKPELQGKTMTSNPFQFRHFSFSPELEFLTSLQSKIKKNIMIISFLCQYLLATWLNKPLYDIIKYFFV